MAIVGLSVDQAGASVARMVQGTVQKTVASLPSGSLFEEALGQVAAKRTEAAVQGRVDKEVRRLDSKLGGTVNREALQQALGGDVAGAVNKVVEHKLGPIAGRPGDTSTPYGVAAGAVGGNAPWDASLDLKQWGGLSTHLIAQLCPCDENGQLLRADGVIQAPITDANVELTMNWQSAFENIGPESKMPTLMAMAQSGELAAVAGALQSTALGELAGKAATKAVEIAQGLKGRSGITKLNSMQAFTGMPPVKINLTLHFRAVLNAKEEVLLPLRSLMQWALPKKLAADGRLTSLIKQGGDNWLSILLPSLSPVFVSLTYGGETYAPLVIESVQRPLDGPRDKDGDPLYLAVPVTLATLTALDRDDVKTIFQRG